MARKTLADVHWDQAILADRKQTLLRLLRLRWAPLPAEMEQIVEATQDADRLAEWQDRVVTARDLDAVGIHPPR